MSVQYMLEAADAPVVWRGPRKTALIKRFVKDTFWGRLDYLVVGMKTINVHANTRKANKHMHKHTSTSIVRVCMMRMCSANVAHADTPPGTSDEHLTVVGALKNSRPDGAVIVTTPHPLSLGTVRKEVWRSCLCAFALGPLLADSSYSSYCADQFLSKDGNSHSGSS